MDDRNVVTGPATDLPLPDKTRVGWHDRQDAFGASCLSGANGLCSLADAHLVANDRPHAIGDKKFDSEFLMGEKL